MSIDIETILAAAPITTRGQPTQLSIDLKGQCIAYASGKSIFLRSLDDPSKARQYTSHSAATTVARFSPSGFYIASGDVSGMVRVWDVAGEDMVTKGEYSIISGRINDVAWDWDSQRVIAVGNGRERFGHCFTADSGNSVGELSGHSKVINSVAIRQQRPLRAATVADDGAMCFLHGAPFKFANKADKSHIGFVYGVAFSPDGSQLVTVGADRKIQLYDGKTGEPTKKMGETDGHTGSIFAVCWAKDSKRIVTASADQTVKIWDVEDDRCVQTWRFGGGNISIPNQQVGVAWAHGRSDGLIVSLSLSGDLNYLVEGKEKPTKVVQGHNKNVTALSASADGKSLTTGSFDGKVCGWDVASGNGAVIDGQSHTNQVKQFAAASPKRTYSVGWDDTLRIIDIAAGTFLGGALALTGQPQGLTGTADGRVMVATHKGVAVYADDRLASEISTPFTPTAVAAKDQLVAVGADDNTINIYRLDGSNKLTLTETISNSTAAIASLAFSPDGKYLSAGNTSGKIFAYKTADWTVATDRWSAHAGRVTCLAWNEAGTHAVSGGLDTNVFVWSLAKPGSRVRAANAHKDGVMGIAWLQSRNKIVSSGGDGAVKIWKVVL